MSDSLRERVKAALGDVAQEFGQVGALRASRPSDGLLSAQADAALAAIEASGTHVVVPVQPTQEQQIMGTSAMGEAMQPFADKLKAEGRDSEAITLMVVPSGYITGPVYRAMIAARPHNAAPMGESDG